MTKQEPEIKAADLGGLFAHVGEMSRKVVSWQGEELRGKFSFIEYPEMLDIDLVNRQVSINENKIMDFAALWADLFDNDAGEIRVKELVQQEAGYLKANYEGSFLHSRKVDRQKLYDDLLAALKSTETETVLDPEIKSIEEYVQIKDGQKLTLLARGISSYKLGNYEDRMFNVRYGLNRYDGVVIPQGGEFSFNQILGKVTYDDGWKPAQAIFGGGGVRDVPGGGLCQVSTTVYRAAINTGLQITERKPHHCCFSQHGMAFAL